MLRDAARFARHHVGLAQRVEQRGLAVIDMAHDGDDRRARLERSGSSSSSALSTFSTSPSVTRLSLWPNSVTMSSAVSASMLWLTVTIVPIFMSVLTTSTARSAMRLASSCTVMASGITTSRMIFSCGRPRPFRRAGFLALAAQRGKAAHALFRHAERLAHGDLAGVAARFVARGAVSSWRAWPPCARRALRLRRAPSR